MQQIDPPVEIDPNVWATYEAAHVQAEAAIRAAEIGAKAAWDAATLQAWVAAIAAVISLVAAVAVFFAGRWAYHAAIEAAKNQTRLENEKHNARVAAYSVRQKYLIERLQTQIKREIGFISELTNYIESGHEVRYSNYIDIPDDLEEEWNNEHWENHLLLGEKFVKSLITVVDRFRTLRDFRKSVIDEGVEDPSRPGSYTFEDKTLFFSVSENFQIYKNILYKFDESLSNLLNAIPT